MASIALTMARELRAAVTVKGGQRMAKSVRIPITNVFMNGDYTGRIHVGSHNRAVNVILDTGSSAFALDGHKYHPDTAAGDKTTTFAQTDRYGDNSGWTGAVLKTKVSLGDGAAQVTIPDANVAVAYEQTSNMFRSADGILGLAYAPLDDAYRMPQDTWAHKYYRHRSQPRREGRYPAPSDSARRRERRQRHRELLHETVIHTLRRR